MFTYVYTIFLLIVLKIFIVNLCTSSKNNVEKRREESIGGERRRRGERRREDRELRGKRREEKRGRMYVTCLLLFVVLGMFLCVVFIFFSGEVVWLCA